MDDRPLLHFPADASPPPAREEQEEQEEETRDQQEGEEERPAETASTSDSSTEDRLSASARLFPFSAAFSVDDVDDADDVDGDTINLNPRNNRSNSSSSSSRSSRSHRSHGCSGNGNGENGGGATRVERAARRGGGGGLPLGVRRRLLHVLVQDGLHSRQFAVSLKSADALWWYEYTHAAKSRMVFMLAAILFMMLIFVEKPSSNARSNAHSAPHQYTLSRVSTSTGTKSPVQSVHQYVLPPSVTLPVECALLAVVWLDVFAHLRYHGRAWRRQLCRPTWTASRFLVALVITLDLATTPVGIPTRFSRGLRVWLLLSRMRNLRNALSMAFRTLPAVSLIGAFVFFFMILFALVGWLIFDPSHSPWDQMRSNATTKSGLCSSYDEVCDGYFSSFPDALYQMWILLAGVNYPNVMLPYYALSRWAALFFMVYLTLGRIFMMRLLITAAYGAYQEELFKRIETRELRATKAFTATFRIMSRVTGGVRAADWLALVCSVRPDLGAPVARAIFDAAAGLGGRQANGNAAAGLGDRQANGSNSSSRNRKSSLHTNNELDDFRLDSDAGVDSTENYIRRGGGGGGGGGETQKEKSQ
jgi:hypothetical protein